MDLAAVRNDICVVLVGTRQEDDCWSAARANIGLMMSIRRLFFAGDRVPASVAATVADGLMAYPTLPAVADHASAALGAGLAVIAFRPDIFGDEILRIGQVMTVGEASADLAVDSLSAWLDLGDAQRAPTVAKTLECLQLARGTRMPDRSDGRRE
jgi:hypothetical protein